MMAMSDWEDSKRDEYGAKVVVVVVVGIGVRDCQGVDCEEL